MFAAKNVLTPEFIGQPLDKLWSLISPLYMVDESEWLEQLLPLAMPTEEEKTAVTIQTTQLIEAIRADKKSIQMIDALLLEYSLDTQEGILLMCLAEALMRIPDSATADALIKDKLSVADWKSHLKSSDSVFVNASTWGLMLTGKVIGLGEQESNSPSQAVNRLVNKFSEPVIRKAMYQAMKIMGHQFVRGRTIEEAQKNGQSMRDKGFTYSFDMLGEAALTSADAQKYFKDYLMAIEAVGRENATRRDNSPAPSVSIKLSALHPRYEVANEERVLTELCDTLTQLLQRAIEVDVAITIDAEEADRLELSLKLFEKLYRSEQVKGWGKFGLVVQAYSKRALPVLVWLNGLAKEQGDLIPLRLVKGAYWDSEIKWSQQAGYDNYPVYTRKEATDVAYLACARFLLSEGVRGNIFPQFASHNAHTVTAIAVMAQHKDYEFQRLHGMGDSLYNHVMKTYGQPVRIYAPVGSHADLLPYLVRRLLENGANSSFVHRLVDARCPVSELTQHPVDVLTSFETLNNAKIPMPTGIFPERKNSYGVNIDIHSEAKPFEAQVEHFLNNKWIAGPIINGVNKAESMIKEGNVETITAPYDRRIEVGQVAFATLDHVSEAIDVAHVAFPAWKEAPIENKAACLEKLADLMEDNLVELVAICHQEAGKTIHDSIDEVREAVDFCRYYAKQASNLQSVELEGFDGVKRLSSREGLGVFVCISPWNFPLAIFLGQISAALIAGNTVVAKPAEQTSLIAARAIELMFAAGFPTGVIQLLPGRGGEIGHALTSHDAIAGVAFTGSTATAQRINVTLAERDAKPVPFIAETGGQNAMIVDSTALPEQVVRDVIRSAFASAGQRCSALRVLFVQEDVADRIIHLIKGAMSELQVGIPYLHKTDVGPVIDANAKNKLLAHIEQMSKTQTKVAQLSLAPECEHGDFVAPSAFEISSIDVLKEEQFGPILHIVRFKANELPNVVEQINTTGFGLTMGIHSRNETTYRWIEKHVRVGNCYINRDQVGAVVGVQPFGGQGLSGTGPKAGGPHYLYRFTQHSLTQADNA
ncbi:bifunctional proline dehydrogenase/L-glutamate gamma-semialdehyde dehydrogenase [Vibrio azureus]|uniref:Bifunctional protein PutA n=1 Tax=Vibrio azureus NBRC 104587 TaxID=1219077 RepID=U3C7Q0_9VIBR|nr:bifunctional proline dehydrogenase/L-glutamate gamma-semialdehyde dehydrogenase PutA [Vibrio azureus]AUI87512.1 bifunctional proline dehydrogenase/L-glutamate gamma-semialdehyde dehydrogenase [Vibrio azureus]GAD74478.1 proline dehydrogenase/delta-1-pyrroline-5-carboxylate dehydrogenase [Vibrio azureus NBRC 104587]